MQTILEAAEAGRKLAVGSTCEKPAALPPGLALGALA
jgi:hypothetical protein